MAEKQQLEIEVVQIFKKIRQGKNFLLSGGAGSGKTYSLVQVIKKVLQDNPMARIACITYTNAAVKEIESRVKHPNLIVSTIHDFLWDCIKSFQKELMKGLVALIQDENSFIKSQEGDEITEDYLNSLEGRIQYKEWIRIRDGHISHDEVIELANYMFEKYRLLCDIFKDKFSFVFVDEYQDTHPNVIEILLVHIEKSTKHNVIGFFGDSMQSIYDDGIGNLKKYIDIGKVEEVQKKQNRRNPKKIISLSNRLRTDGLEQEPSKDINAPNMENGLIKEGDIKFIYSDTDNLEKLKTNDDIFLDWDFKNAKLTKELNLTHNLIAPKAGYPTLMEIYDKDRILEYKQKVNDYIKDNGIVINDEMTFGQVIELTGVEPSNGVMKVFINDNPDLFKEAKKYPFSLFKKIYLANDHLTDDKKQDAEEEAKKGSKRDHLIKHLFKIQQNIHLYKSKQFNEFLRRSSFRISSIEDKKKIKAIIETLDSMSESAIEEIIRYSDEVGLCKIDDNFNRFIQEKEYVYNRVKNVSYQEFINLYNYLEGFTPFSTQHKTKGNEFDNVLVIMDNGKWTKYNFQYLFENKGTQTVLERSQKLFYVCCTRAKEKLVIFFYKPNQEIITRAKEWFGNENVIYKS